MRRSTLIWFAAAGLLRIADPALSGESSTDPARVNLIRRLNPQTGASVITNAYSAFGCANVRQGGGNYGSGWNDESNDSNTIIQAGWTLQYARGTPGAQAAKFTFAIPKPSRYVALVWDAQFGAGQELELYAKLPSLLRGTVLAVR